MLVIVTNISVATDLAEKNCRAFFFPSPPLAPAYRTAVDRTGVPLIMTNMLPSDCRGRGAGSNNYCTIMTNELWRWLRWVLHCAGSKKLKEVLDLGDGTALEWKNHWTSMKDKSMLRNTKAYVFAAMGA